MVDNFDFAIFVFSPDDTTNIRKTTYKAVRDNVILELGFFLPKIGRERCFIIRPNNATNLRLPTDILGITVLTFDNERSDGNLRAAVGPACNRIRDVVKEKGEIRRYLESGPGPIHLKKLSEKEKQDNKRIEDDLKKILIKSRKLRNEASLMFVDIDRFSSLNKWYGEDTCDELIQFLENMIKEKFKKGYITRIGGDQFICCLEKVTQAAALRMANDFVTQVTQTNYDFIAPNLYVTVSAGVVCYREKETVQEWIIRAIHGSICAKKSGGSRVAKGPIGLPLPMYNTSYEQLLSD